MKQITIAVDAMGGDHGPPVTVPAALLVLNQYENLQLTLVGDQDRIQLELKKHSNWDKSRLSIQHASQTVEMDESPTQAMRSKKDSSMRVAINLVKEKEAHACVSAGNTGALMATARFVLKTLPGIDRPAIMSSFPTLSGKPIHMLDLGANVDSTPENLYQFAIMGTVVVAAVENIQRPTVALLNIGQEDIKGNELVKETAKLLAQSPVVNYVGYIEGDKLYQSDHVDVVVCDGFVGNVALKTSEGVVVFVRKLLKEGFYRTPFTKLIGFLAMPILKKLIKRIDPDRHNGASFVGLCGTVIKSHGGARISAFARAIEQAIIEVDKTIPERLSQEVERLLKLSSKDSSV